MNFRKYWNQDSESHWIFYWFSKCMVPQANTCSPLHMGYILNHMNFNFFENRCTNLVCFFISERTQFLEAAQRGNLVPVYRRIFADHLTPVLAYRCLVKEDDREAPSFLFESVENGKSINMVSACFFIFYRFKGFCNFNSVTLVEIPSSEVF